MTDAIFKAVEVEIKPGYWDIRFRCIECGCIREDNHKKHECKECHHNFIVEMVPDLSGRKVKRKQLICEWCRLWDTWTISEDNE